MAGTVAQRILTDDIVEDAVLDHLEQWIPSKLSEIEDQLGLGIGYYQRPISYEVRTGFDKFPEEMLPMICVVSIGSDDRPAKTGDRKYRVLWDIGVIVVNSSTDREHARRATYRLGAAARAALIHRPGLDGALDETVRGIEWLGFVNNELPPEDDRTIRAQRQVFRVEVADVLTWGAGPAVPPSPPPGDPDGPPPPSGDWPVITDRSKIRTSITHAIGDTLP